MSSGAAQSGKPWPRLTAPYFTASRLISRITDSVNDAAFWEMCDFENFGCCIRRFKHRKTINFINPSLGQTPEIQIESEPVVSYPIKCFIYRGFADESSY